MLSPWRPPRDRVPTQRFASIIGAAWDAVPPGIRDRLSHVRFACGVDPVFAGLHTYETIADGRSYSATAHCCYPGNLLGPRDRRVTTIILPVELHPWLVVHELGHALHHVISFEHGARPVTNYAMTNSLEAFAEAFVAWRYHYGDQGVASSDQATRTLFADLAR